jgi:hypothetical protein
MIDAPELDDVRINDLIWQSIAEKRKIENNSNEFAITFKNGNTYQGEMQGQQLHGKGKYVWTDGTVYEGERTNHQLRHTYITNLFPYRRFYQQFNSRTWLIRIL